MNHEQPLEEQGRDVQERTAGGSADPNASSTGRLNSSTFRPETNAADDLPATGVTRHLGDYELLDVIGTGGMGVVYRAHQRRLNRTVALKTLNSGAMASVREIKRFRLEAEAAARLDHPGIVPVYEINEQDGVVFFSMGYIQGESLQQRLHRNTLSPQDAATLIRDLAEAVAYAHAAGVVHRDLKPGNVLLDRQGSPRISDFGLAQIADGEPLTITGAVMGTPSYMAPEQAMGDGGRVGERTDVYALGAILYSCLCGHAPFRAESAAATMHQVIYAAPVPLCQLRVDIPRDLETICAKCLEKEPDARYASATQLRDELQRYLEGRPILAHPISNLTRLDRWRKRNPVIAALLAVVAVTLLAGTTISLYFAVLAQRRAATAERGYQAASQQSRLALKTIQTVIYTVHERLRTIPETREVRGQLLQDILADLENVASSYLDLSSVDRESAVVFAQLGQLFSEIGDESGTSTIELSDRYYRKSVDLYQQLLAGSPDDEGLRSMLIEVARAYGDTAREYRRFEQSQWAHRLARQHADEALRRRPNDADAQLAFIESTEALGEVLIRDQQTIEEGRTYCSQALELALAFRETHPSTASDELASLCYCTLGDMHRLAGELEQAETAYREMCLLTADLLQADPDNPQRVLDQAGDQERLGDLYMARKDYAKARECYEACLQLSVDYAEGDPTNLYRWQQATWGFQKVAQVCVAQGEFERARSCYQKFIELCDMQGDSQRAQRAREQLAKLPSI
jgi:serine/threonine protein kinase